MPEAANVVSSDCVLVEGCDRMLFCIFVFPEAPIVVSSACDLPGPCDLEILCGFANFPVVVVSISSAFFFLT